MTKAAMRRMAAVALLGAVAACGSDEQSDRNNQAMSETLDPRANAADPAEADRTLQAVMQPLPGQPATPATPPR